MARPNYFAIRICRSVASRTPGPGSCTTRLHHRGPYTRQPGTTGGVHHRRPTDYLQHGWELFDGGRRGLTGVGGGRFSSGVFAANSYVERLPVAGLAGVVRTVWIQRIGANDHVHRHLPSGGVEIHFPIGGAPRLLGPLTRPAQEIIPAGTTLVGVRFHPGTAPPLPAALDELVDQHLGLEELWGNTADRLVEGLARATSPERSLLYLQAQLLNEFRRTDRLDPLVREAVRALMPWQPVSIDSLASALALSSSQLRRRCLQAVGTTPKVLQRTLRFQGFLAMAQAGATPSGRRGVDGTAGLAIDAGYADQAHLSRECLRLTGVTPTQLLGENLDRCGCDHDHSGSYLPFLAGMHDLFKKPAVARS